MGSSLHSSFLSHSLQILPSNYNFQHPTKIPSKIPISYSTSTKSQISCINSNSLQVLRKCGVPLALSLVIFCSNPAEAGILSGFSGIESVPGPELPKIDFLDRYNEENQKKYAENDERIKSSPIIKELLERSKKNKEKNKQEIMDKYCIRGAEWGVGDCSTQGMTAEEKDNFIAMLKRKAGVE